ncbi:MAG: permease [Prolixibacteraceae bacterium]
MVVFIESYFLELWQLTIEMAPYLLFGFLFAGLLHIYLQKEKVGRMLNGNNFRSVLNATLLGIPLPLCSCGVIPAGLSFHKNGASKGSTVSFLISTPQTGIDSILVTYSLLGLPFAIIRPIVALLTGITGGLFANKISKNTAATPVVAKDRYAHLSFFGKMKTAVKYGFVEFIQDISKWLVIGLLLAALLAVVIPDDFFTQYIDYPWLNMLLVLAASIPLYICATGSVPIAAVLIMKGLSPGAALVFLMAGPATNIATMTVLWKSIGSKATLVYLATIVGGALIFGFLIDSFLPAQWFAFTGEMHAHQHVLPNWLGMVSAVVLIALVVNGYILNYLNTKKMKANEFKFDNMMVVQKYQVEGMTCKNCKAHVERDLAEIEGIDGVVADFTSGEVSITGNKIDIEKVKLAVERGGYTFKGKL